MKDIVYNFNIHKNMFLFYCIILYNIGIGTKMINFSLTLNSNSIEFRNIILNLYLVFLSLYLRLKQIKVLLLKERKGDN